MPLSVYQRLVVPYLVHLSMRHERLEPYRRRVASAARGRVLEIGIGSGVNFRFYPDHGWTPNTTENADHIASASRAHPRSAVVTTSIVGIDPSPKLLTMAQSATANATAPVELIEGSAEALPLEDRSVDTVVSTWTLCSIPDVQRALRDIRRVLRPDGQLLFVEHGAAPDPSVSRWQHRLTPVWKRLAGGCHLDRPIDTLIERAGFAIDRLDAEYMEGPKVLTFMYEGAAHPA